MEKIRIEQVEPRFAHELETPLKNTLKKLGYSIPESFRLRVSLLQANEMCIRDREQPARAALLELRHGPGQTFPDQRARRHGIPHRCV